jgi:hypothetical protein
MNEIIEQSSADLRTVASEAGALILDAGSMDSIMRLADIMAKGRATVPTHFQGNAADCAAVIMQAIQWRMNPYAVAQKTHVVSGALGYEAQLVNAVIQSSGVTTDRFSYEWFGEWEKVIGKSKVLDMPAKGEKKAYQFRVPDYDMRAEDGLGIRVWATLKGEIEPRTLELLLVQASVRNSPLWATDPKQQLAYLAVKRWTRLYAPDVILGVYTPDELDDSRPQERDITPGGQARAALPDLVDVEPLIAAAKATKTDTDALAYWKQTNPRLAKQPRDHAKLKEAVALHRAALKAVDADRTVDMPAPKPVADAAPATAAAMNDFDAGMDQSDYVPE